MTTGKIIKLVSYLNFLSDCLKQPINFCDSDSGQYKANCINVDNDKCMRKDYVNLTLYENTCVFFGDDYPSDIVNILRELSGDISATAQMRAEFSPADDEHKNPEYVLRLTIDGETVCVTKNGWR